MNAQPVRLVLFDLDGTLLETAPEIRDAVNATLDSLGLAAVTLEQVERWIGHGTGALLAKALAHATAVPDAHVRTSGLWNVAQARFAIEYERRCGTNSRVYPRGRETLQALQWLGVRCAIVTNKEESFTRRLLLRHRLRELLDLVVCGDTAPARKPDAAGVHACLREFGVTPQQAVFVGDSRTDVATARNAGVPIWAVDHGYNEGEPIASAGPDRVLAGLGEVLELTAAASTCGSGAAHPDFLC